MREIFEELHNRYSSIGINRQEKSEIERYSSHAKEKKDATGAIIEGILTNINKYPEELVQKGFGHGVKYDLTRTENNSNRVYTQIDSEVEETEDSSQEEQNESEEENDYMNNYYNDDEAETMDEIEDML
ncbi:hypothetical protein NEOKW01_0399 [Nematocida sp. AWRm80]|nr:hypothetical protein NEOKW01_0399 [Nematocida sp. AWRm80]